MNQAQKAVLAYIAQQPPLPADYYEQKRLADAALEDLRRREFAAREERSHREHVARMLQDREDAKQKKLRKKEEKLAYDAADIALNDFLSTSSTLWAVTKKRTVNDDYWNHKFVIPLAVFESEGEAKAALSTFSSARKHRDGRAFEVKPMPFFKKCGAA